MLRNVEALHTFSGMATRGGGLAERTWLSSEIGTAANRWVGENRAGWSDPSYDSLFERFTGALDASERTRLVVQMIQRQSQELPTLDGYTNIYTAGPHILMQLTHCPALMPPAPYDPLSSNERRVILSWFACGAMNN